MTSSSAGQALGSPPPPPAQRCARSPRSGTREIQRPRNVAGADAVSPCRRELEGLFKSAHESHDRFRGSVSVRPDSFVGTRLVD